MRMMCVSLRVHSQNPMSCVLYPETWVLVVLPWRGNIYTMHTEIIIFCVHSLIELESTCFSFSIITHVRQGFSSCICSSVIGVFHDLCPVLIFNYIVTFRWQVVLSVFMTSQFSSFCNELYRRWWVYTA